jgi:hypothetical protein
MKTVWPPREEGGKSIQCLTKADRISTQSCLLLRTVQVVFLTITINIFPTPWPILSKRPNRTVRELMGRVRNVVLIKYIFGSGKPKGGRDFGWEGTWVKWGNRGVSLRATWRRGGRILSRKEGSK